MSSSKPVNRRDFVNIILAFLGTLMGAVIGIPAIGYLLSPATKVQRSEAWIPLGVLEAYPLNTPTLFSFTRTKVNGWEKTVNSFGVFVKKNGETEVVVFSNMCTHLSCRVSWKDEAKEYVCPCHDAHFDQDGNVLAGPPPAPLYRYETKIENGNLYLHLKEA